MANTQQGGTWTDVAPELMVTVVLNVILLAGIVMVVRHTPEMEVALNPA